VEAVGVSKQFGSTRALRSVDIAIQPGRCLGLVGRNGAGKSTLVSILSGLFGPDSGEVRFRRTSRSSARQDRRVAQSQSPHVFPALDGSSLTSPSRETSFLGRQPRRTAWSTGERMRSETRRVLREWDFE